MRSSTLETEITADTQFVFISAVQWSGQYGEIYRNIPASL